MVSLQIGSNNPLCIKTKKQHFACLVCLLEKLMMYKEEKKNVDKISYVWITRLN